MPEWIPVPGSAKARLIEAALHHFERAGFEGSNVTDIAAKASVTTGSLYHHFGSKLGLYTVVRTDLERRVTDRMEGAAESAGMSDAIPDTPGDATCRAAVRSAVLVAFDAAVRFDACRVLGEPPPHDDADPIEVTVRAMLSRDLEYAAGMLVAAWRSALLNVAGGATVAPVRSALEFVIHD
ncbi:TetR/AcrR family transcriptional regulator [Actinobacteria bacterium YIM 96077]|uniref:TetR/AcrR family transcriptional regulator n=1 Tax=Phytoactinopolyspora halophila TaxID=1981511 RepID=A0A329QF13_9ACTN|nr:helix-turn-helix domain-containing protein [Phytoactinopolyspora halophila]AYY15587.1 TetR/AcrR family transcriptional regulator [Actinobacteria bacterium YIM 96077]RAW10299.1 TetR/AcrR family transcriptional regulator [Phytoactinopolyspora halophila]